MSRTRQMQSTVAKAKTVAQHIKHDIINSSLALLTFCTTKVRKVKPTVVRGITSWPGLFADFHS